MAALYGMMQARLQHRHGLRMNEAQWRRLTGAGSFEQFLARARETHLGSWLEGVDPNGDVHHLELVLQEACRRHLTEVVSWAPKAWQPAGLWVGQLADLSVALYRQEKGLTFPWMHQTDGHETMELPSPGQDPKVWWLTHWQSLWPKERVNQAQLHELIHLLQTSLDHFSGLEGTEAANTFWQTVQAKLELSFRRYAMRPAALFVHLILTYMDLNRLRGELIRRRLFVQIEATS